MSQFWLVRATPVEILSYVTAAESDTAPLVPGAEICVWRVYGINNDYLASRGSDVDWTLKIGDWPTPGDHTKVIIGGPPTFINDAINSATATLVTAFGGGDWRKSDDPKQARDQAIEGNWRQHPIPELTEGYGLWATVIVSRPIEVKEQGIKYAWVPGGQAVELSKQFEPEAGRHLDSVSSFLAHALGGIRFDRTIIGGNLAYFIAPGKGPFSWGRTEFPPLTISTSHAWDDIPFSNIAKVLTDAKTVPGATLKKMASAARMLWLAKGEEDELHRFLFAFSGLELLVNSYANDSIRDEVVQLLKQETRGLPIEGMFWPSTHTDKDYPWRNLAFKFTLTAISLSRISASDDLTLFQTLNKARNRLAHGLAGTTESYPARECIELFEKYVTLVFARTVKAPT